MFVGSKVTDIMVSKVVTVSPDDSVLTAAKLMSENKFDGLPVIDADGTLQGLVTQSNLISRSGNVHVPTLLTLINKFDLYRKDRKLIDAQLKVINSLKVSDVMNPEPPLIYSGESVEKAFMQLSSTHGSSPTSVVDISKRLLGVITRFDILKTYTGKIGNSGWAVNDTRLEDKRVDSFINDFSSKFLFISRWRTRMWLAINIAFLLGGIYIATLAIVRVHVG